MLSITLRSPVVSTEPEMRATRPHDDPERGTVCQTPNPTPHNLQTLHDILHLVITVLENFHVLTFIFELFFLSQMSTLETFTKLQTKPSCNVNNSNLPEEEDPKFISQRKRIAILSETQTQIYLNSSRTLRGIEPLTIIVSGCDSTG